MRSRITRPVRPSSHSAVRALVKLREQFWLATSVEAKNRRNLIFIFVPESSVAAISRAGLTESK
jgi:hypothetical protein